MEIDSALSTLALLLSTAAFALAELGAAAIVARIQELARGPLNGTTTDPGSLRLAAGIPAGPTAPLRLVSLMALAAAIVSSAALAMSVGGGGWLAFSAGTVGALAVLKAAAYVARRLGVGHAEAVSGFMARASWMLSFPLRPILLVEATIARRMPAFPTASEPYLEVMLSIAQEQWDEHEVRMIRGVVRLDKTVAREIMAPRVDIVAVESDATLETLVERMDSAGHSRIPVYEGDLDRIIGVAHARDVLPKLAKAGGASQSLAKSVIREPLFIPESKTLEGLLDEFREGRTHLAVVVDEYGGVSGIVTIEDLLEEIVGEIRDEFDAEDPEIEVVSETEFVVDARVAVDDLNEALGVNVVGEGFDTIGGLVFDRLGKVPVSGDTVKHAGLSIEVVSTSGRRPTTLKVTRSRTPAAERERGQTPA